MHASKLQGSAHSALWPRRLPTPTAMYLEVLEVVALQYEPAPLEAPELARGALLQPALAQRKLAALRHRRAEMLREHDRHERHGGQASKQTAA